MPDTRPNAREVTRVRDQDRRMRLVYMVIFAIIAYSLFWLILFLAAVQFVLSWINRRPNENLRDFSGKVNAYFHGVLDFVGYASDTVPFPFSPLEASVAAAAPAKPAPRKRGKGRGATAAKEEPRSD